MNGIEKGTEGPWSK